MEQAGDPEAWELSKENIQPLKQGRNASALSVALDESSIRKLNSIRHEFEEELRTYSGDDSLDVWYRYILWVEQNYPKGGKDGNLKKLIQNCITSIHGNTVTAEKYRNDGRFLCIWFKYANICPSPLEVYSTLETKGIGTGLADYYINWSWELERIGNFKRADAIYKKGLEACAAPLDVLEEAHKKFQSRVARATVEGRTNENETEVEDDHRIALTSLKVQGKKNKVAYERTGSNVMGPAGRVSQTRSASNAGGPTFSIFQDNGNMSAVDGGNTKKGGSLPIRSTLNKENVKDPSKWTKVKVAQKTTGVMSVEDLNNHQKPAFTVHEDEGISQPGKTPSQLPETSNVLSVRTNSNEYGDWHVSLFIPEPFNPKVQPQYCKHKVYCGTEEFSFEELRAANFFKEERKKEELESKIKEINANQIQQMQDMIKKQEEMIQNLLQQASHTQTPQITVTSPHEAGNFLMPQKVQDKVESKDQNNFHDSWVCMNKSVNVNQSVNVSHFLEESSTRAMLQLKPATLNSLCGEIAEGHEHNSSSGALNSSSSQGGLNHSSGNRNNSRGLNLSDPTVNTKMAMNAMQEMWSASLFKEDSLAIEAGPEVPFPKENEPFAIFQDNECAGEKSSAQKTTQPFNIYADDGVDQSRNSVAPFAVYQDEALIKGKTANTASDPNELYPERQDENAPPEGFTQEKKARSLAGVLQPATNIPVGSEDDIDGEDKIKEHNFEIEEKSSGKDNNFEDDFFPIDGTMLADFTLKMPHNPEAFEKSLKIASTPAVFAKQHTEDNTVGDLLKGGNFFPVEEEDEEKEKENSGELMPHPGASRPTSSPPGFGASAKHLSPIIEASREYRSSSSSSSGYSTTSTTLGVTHYGGFSTTQTVRSRHNSHSQAESALETGAIVQTGDFTKSGYLADKSRGESIAESKLAASQNPAQVEDENTFDPQKAAKMLMDMDKFSFLPSPKGEPKASTGNKIAKGKLPEKVNVYENVNPFSKELIQKLLNNLENKVEMRGGYVQMNEKVPTVKPNLQLTLEKEMFYIRRLCGKGAYAEVFQASTVDPLNVTVFPSNIDGQDEDDDNDEHQMILKLQKPACPWEFYICHELRSRLKPRFKTNMLDSMMRINRGYFFKDGSILVNEYHKYGTVLDVVNRYKLSGTTLPEDLIIVMMIEVISIVDALHSCNIIHADIKPDNFLFRSMPQINSASTYEEVFEYCPSSLKLIDFGRSIDMQLLPGTTFTEKVTTEGFTCCEMREGKPWTYETDYYGIAAIAYCLLFGSYMDVKKNSNGKWELKTGTMKRYWQKDLWQSLFSILLNSPPANSLKKLRVDFMKRFVELDMLKGFSETLRTLKILLAQKI